MESGLTGQGRGARSCAFGAPKRVNLRLHQTPEDPCRCPLYDYMKIVSNHKRRNLPCRTVLSINVPNTKFHAGIKKGKIRAKFSAAISRIISTHEN